MALQWHKGDHVCVYFYQKEYEGTIVEVLQIDGLPEAEPRYLVEFLGHGGQMGYWNYHLKPSKGAAARIEQCTEAERRKKKWAERERRAAEKKRMAAFDRDCDLFLKNQEPAEDGHGRWSNCWFGARCI